MAGTTTSSVRDVYRPGMLEADLTINFNKLIDDLATALAALVGTGNVTTATPTIGTTVTVSMPANVIQIAGVATLLTAISNQGLGALGTIPASKWGIITFERVAAGTLTFVSGAANYTTGYATEAAAIAAMPAITAGKVRVGYITILATASTWIAATDALAGGTGGNPATTTNYYPGVSLFDSTLYLAAKIGDRTGTAITA